jgi:hypothetical protein
VTVRKQKKGGINGFQPLGVWGLFIVLGISLVMVFGGNSVWGAAEGTEGTEITEGTVWGRFWSGVDQGVTSFKEGFLATTNNLKSYLGTSGQFIARFGKEKNEKEAEELASVIASQKMEKWLEWFSKNGERLEEIANGENFNNLYLSGAIDGQNIANRSLNGNLKIIPGSITGLVIANGSVSKEDILWRGITSVNLHANAVTTRIIKDGTIIGADLSDDLSFSTTGTIHADNINGNHLIVKDGSTLSGDTVFNGGAFSHMGTTFLVNETGDATFDSDAVTTFSGSRLELVADGGGVTITYPDGQTFQLKDRTTRIETLANGSLILGNDSDATTVDGSVINLSGNTVINGTITGNITDNASNAFDLQEGTNKYLNISTVDGSEKIDFGNTTLNPSYEFLGTGATTLGGNLTVNGALIVGGGTAVAGHFLPGSNNVYNLGSNTYRWANLYLGGETLHLGASITDEAVVSYDTTINILNIGTDATTNGDIAFFSDDLYLDKSSGNVGIGTTDPGAKLDVAGVATFRGNLLFSTDNTLDIGANGATRPRTGYFGTSVVAPNFTGLASSATILATARDLYGFSFNGSVGTVSGINIIASSYGGTGNGFTKFTGPTTAEKTFTLPDANAIIARTDAGQTFTGVNIFTSPTFTTSIVPTINDGTTIGTTTLQFSDLFLASGATINYANGDTTLTHSTGILTLGTGTLKITTPTNTATSVATIDGMQTLTNKTLTASNNTLGGVTMTLGTDATGDIYYRNVSGYLTRLGIGTSNQILHGGTTPSYSAISLTGDITGILPLANGGTNKNITASSGAIIFSDTDSMELTLVGSSGQILVSQGAGTPIWSTPTYPSASGSAGKIIRSNGANNIYSTAAFADTYTASNLLYSNGDNTVQGLATANNGVLITGVTGVPSISSTIPVVTQQNITNVNSALVTGLLQITTTTGALTSVTTSAGIDALISNNTGSGLLVFNDGPTFIAPTLGVATATSINGLTINTTTGTLAISNLKTLTASDSTTLATNAITLAGGEVITFSPTNALSLLTTGATSVTLPTSGTLISTDQTVGQTIGLTGSRLTKLWATNIESTNAPTVLGSAVYYTGGTDVSLADGGTNASLTANNGGIFYSTGTAGAILAGTSTANQILLSGSLTTPVWSTATYPVTTMANQLLYSSALNTVTGLTTANSGVLVTNATGNPSFLGSLTNGQLVVGSTGAIPVLATLTGTDNQIVVTNGAGTITLSTSQSINTTSTPQFARIGLGVSADTTNILTATSVSTTDLSKTLNISHTGAITGTGYAGYFSKTGASTTNVGLYTIATGATNNYALQIDSAVAGANNYTIYANGTAQSYFAGNVGIGTTAPSSLLSVGGAGSSSYSISGIGSQSGIYGSASAGYTGVYGLSTSGAGISGSSTSGVGGYFTSSVGYALITGNGNVGIGTTAPESKLHVSADGAVQIFMGDLYSDLSYNTPEFSGRRARGTQSLPSAVLAGDTLMLVGARGYMDTGGFSANKAVIHMYAAENFTSTTNGTYITFSTTPIGSTSRAVRMTIGDAGNVGIGTTSPGAKLNIKSNNDASALKLTSSLGGTMMDLYELSDGRIQFNLYDGSGITKVRLDGNADNYITGGNVGIGTTGPSALLHVGSGGTPGYATTGDAYFQNDVEIDGTLYTAGLSVLGSIIPATDDTYDLGSSSYRWRDLYLGPTSLHLVSTVGETTTARDWKLSIQETDGTSEGNLRIMEGATEIMNIQPGGNVGIGTTGPGAKLNVVGGSAGTNTGIFRIENNTNASANTGASVEFYSYDNTPAQVEMGRIGTLVTTGTAGAASSDLAFSARNSGTLTEWMRIKGSGNVGIGTTGPATKLQIAGTGSTNGLSFGDAADVILYRNSSTQLRMNSDLRTSGSSGLTVDGPAFSLGGFNTLYNAASGLQFKANATSQMQLFASGGLALGSTYWSTDPGAGNLTIQGNVGIGTTAPGAALDVIGTGIFQYAALENEGEFLRISRTSQTTRYSSLWARQSVTKANNYIGFRVYDGNSTDYAPVEMMRITGSGNVGIGTTNPTAKLEIGGDNNGLKISGATYVSAELLDGGSNDSGYLSLYRAGVKAFSIGANDTYFNYGNVGIGTTGPAQKLHVFGATPQVEIDSSSGTNPSLFLTTTNDTTQGIKFSYDQGAGDGYIDNVWNNAAGDLFFRLRTLGTPVDVLSLKASGNVGIGTTAPVSKFHLYDSAGSGLSIDTGNGYANLYFLDGGVERWRFRNDGATDDFHLMEDASDIRLTVQEGGNVGIGTTSPLSSFYVGSTTPTSLSYALGNWNSYKAAIVDTFNYASVDDEHTSFLSDLTVNSTVNSSEQMAAIAASITVSTASTADTGSLRTIWSNLQHDGTGTVAAARLFNGELANKSTGTMTKADGLGVAFRNTGGGIISDLRGVNIIDLVNTSGTITNTYGIYTGDLSLGTQTNMPFSFYASDSDTYNYFAGNVGIGTTAPVSKFHLYDSTGSGLSIDTGNGYANLYFLDGGVERWRFRNDGATDDFHLMEDASDIRLTVQEGGNVGIGTTGPLVKLHITTDDVNGNGIRIQNDNALGTWKYGTLAMMGQTGNSIVDWPNALVIEGAGNGGTVISSAAGDIKFNPGRIQGMIVKQTTGNVGIGTTAPGFRLDVPAVSASNYDVAKIGGFVIARAGTDVSNLLITGASWAGGSTLTATATTYASYQQTSGNHYFYTATGQTVGNAVTTVIPMTIVGNGAVANTLYLTAGNVGIGTTSPTQALQITGSQFQQLSLQTTGAYTTKTYFANYAAIGNLNSYWSMNRNIGTGVFDNIELPAAAIAMNGSTGNSSIQFYTAAANNTAPSVRMTIDNSGNVGIGTTSPGDKLSVDGTTYGTTISVTGRSASWPGNATDLSKLNFNGLVGASGGTLASIATRFGNSGSDFSSQLLFSTTDASFVLQERMRINNLGNVGIGTTAPGALLHVGPNSVVYQPTVGTKQLILSGAGNTNAIDNGTMMIFSGGYNSTLAQNATYGAIAGLKENGTDNIASGYLGFYTGRTGDANALEKMRITSTGNVGIGTTGPVEALDVLGKIKASSSVQANGVAIGGLNGLYYSSSTRGKYGFGSVTALGAYPLDLSSGDVTTYTDGYIKFSTAGTEAMRIQSSGNVGIGTTGPGGRLHIADGITGNDATYRGKLIIESGQTDNASNGLEFKASAGASGYGYRLATVYPTSGIDLRFQSRQNSATWSDVMTINTVGNVGIGTTNPGYKLQVRPATDVNLGFGSNAVGGLLNVANDAASVVDLTTNAWEYHFQSNGNERVTILNGGNVGIGTTGPGARLNVVDVNYGFNNVGNLFIRTSDAQAADIGGMIGLGGIGNDAGTGITSFATIAGRKENGTTSNYSGYLQFSTSNPGSTKNEWMRITSTGNVGIGTTAPSQKLHVEGHCLTGDTLIAVRRKKRRNSENGENEIDPDDLDFSLSDFASSSDQETEDCILVPICNILPGDEVLSLNEETNRTEYHPINGLLDMGIQEIYQIRTKSGRVIRTTGNHPYLVKMN